MTEQELRALVRDAIAKSGLADPARAHDAYAPQRLATSRHDSHGMFMLPPGDPEGRCIIEPAVACNHCGHCKSYGY